MGKQRKSPPVALAAILTLGLSGGATAQEAEASSDAPRQAQQGVAQERMSEQDSSRANQRKVADAVVVRPIGFAASLFSTGAFVLTLPFAALDPAIDVNKTRENLVEYPFRETFQRPLGDFEGSAW